MPKHPFGKKILASKKKYIDLYQEAIKENDLEINVLKGKQLTNVRASGSDKAVVLVPPLKMSLEQMISSIKEDELLEVTPNNLRLRKFYLDPHERKRMRKIS